MGIAEETYTADYFQNGSEPGGVVETPQKLAPEAIRTLRDGWEGRHAGPGRRHRLAVLQQGAKWNSTSTDPEKAQLIESRKYQLLEVLRPWRVPPHKAGDFSQSHLANIEASNLDYLMTALMYWLVAIEQQCCLKLFTPAERKAGLYVEHNVNALLRGDIVSRFNAYHSALADGWMNRDEVRQRENLNPIGEETGGDKFLVQLNQTTLEKIGEDETLETPAEAALEEQTGEEAEPAEPSGDEPALESVKWQWPGERMSVLRLLATADDREMIRFQLRTGRLANFLECRGHTVIFTLMNEHFDDILEEAKTLGVTLQRVDGAGDKESYTTVYQGDFPVWLAGQAS